MGWRYLLRIEHGYSEYMETMFDTWVQYINTSLIKHCSLIKHGTNKSEA